jgi:hypothetical protein
MVYGSSRFEVVTTYALLIILTLAAMWFWRRRHKADYRVPARLVIALFALGLLSNRDTLYERSAVAAGVGAGALLFLLILKAARNSFRPYFGDVILLSTIGFCQPILLISGALGAALKILLGRPAENGRTPLGPAFVGGALVIMAAATLIMVWVVRQ